MPPKCIETLRYIISSMRGQIFDKNHPETFTTAKLHKTGCPDSNLAAATLLLDLLASEGNTRFGGRRGAGLVFHPSLDLACHGQECLLNIGGSLRRSLQKLDTKSISEFLSHFSGNDALSFEIALVTHK
jgi:hypothetical protein